MKKDRQSNTLNELTGVGWRWEGQPMGEEKWGDNAERETKKKTDT